MTEKVPDDIKAGMKSWLDWETVIVSVVAFCLLASMAGCTAGVVRWGFGI